MDIIFITFIIQSFKNNTFDLYFKRATINTYAGFAINIDLSGISNNADIKDWF